MKLFKLIWFDFDNYLQQVFSIDPNKQAIVQLAVALAASQRPSVSVYLSVWSQSDIFMCGHSVWLG